MLRRCAGAAGGGENYVGGWLVPFATIIDAGAHADGAEDRVSAGSDGGRLFDDGFGGEAQIHAAKFHQSGGVSMAVDAAVIFKIVIVGNLIRRGPVQEILFELFTFAVLADCAFSLVTLECGEFGFWEMTGEGATDRFFDPWFCAFAGSGGRRRRGFGHVDTLGRCGRCRREYEGDVNFLGRVRRFGQA